MESPADRSAAMEFQQRTPPVRRRLVQSTLFPSCKKGRLFEEENGKMDEVKEGEQQSCNGDKKKSSSTKRKPAKPKATPRASKQIAVNGKEMSMEMNGGFAASVESGIIATKKLEEENMCSPPENKNTSPSPPISTRTHRKEKRRGKLETLKKENVTANQPEVALVKRTPPELVLDEPKLIIIPDLRSEAKITAEENSRIFAGRPLHPFFTSCKASKRNQEIIELEDSQHPTESREVAMPVNPIHVLEAEEGEPISLDWGRWEFSDGRSPSTSSRLGSDDSSFSESVVRSLRVDDFPSSCSINLSTCQNKDKEVDEVNAIQSFSICMSSAAEDLLKFLPKGSSNQENSLWTNKYQPRQASQICGNEESVKVISEWLYHWQKKSRQKSSLNDEKVAGPEADDSSVQSETDSDCSDDETYLKNVLLVKGPVGSGKSAAIYACAQEQGFQVIEVNASDWRNGTLVKQRFGEALESHRHQNKSDNTAMSKRSPSKSLFGTTTVTKGLQDEVGVITVSDEENSQPCATPEMHNEKENGILTDQIQTKTLILFEDVDATLSEDHGFLSTIQQLALTAKRPMILTSNENSSILPKNLERLEVPFEVPSMKELLGLVHLVCHAEKANTPPCFLDRCVKYFQGDIRKTILHIQFWCQGQIIKKGAASGIRYSPLLFDLDAGHHILPKLIPLGFPSHLSELVEADIANSLMSVQESQSSGDIFAEQDLINCSMRNGLRMVDDESDYLTTKKKAMLSLSSPVWHEELLARPGCTEFSDTSGSPVAFAKRNTRRKFSTVMSDSEEDGNDSLLPDLNLLPGDTNGNIPGVSTSPRCMFSAGTFCSLPTEQRCESEQYQEEQISRKRLKTSIHPAVTDACNSLDLSIAPVFNFSPSENGNVLGVSISPTRSFCTETLFGLSTEQRCDSEGFQEEQKAYKRLRTSAGPSVPDVCNSAEVSMVPESLLIPDAETSYVAATVSHNPCFIETDSLISFFPDLPVTTGEQACQPLHKIQEMVDLDDTMPFEELVGNDGVVHEGNVPRQYQMLDECSRCDFATLGNISEKPGFALDCNPVDETWKRLRECQRDLQQHVTPEYRDSLQAMKLTFRMSNLFSETDLLYSHHQPHIDDPVVTSRCPDEVLHSYQWYDDQLEMPSIVAQHGICSYAKEAAALVSSIGSSSRMNLALEMLSASTNSMALGKLLCLDEVVAGSPDTKEQLKSNLERRKMQSSLRSLCHSVVPPRAYLALEGHSFHEYFSALSQISRFEAERVSQHVAENKGRRRRGTQHYLSSGTNMLSPEDISTLSKFNCFHKVACHNPDSNVGKPKRCHW